MLVLALDTSSAAVTAALVSVEAVADADASAHASTDASAHASADATVEVLAVSVTVDARAHGERLAPAIEECLRAAKVSIGDVNAIVAGIGPGPFTGLRVGLVTAAALADALEIPAYGVCSLDAIAGALPSGRLLVAADARRREVYWARYVDGVRTDGPEVSKPAEVDTRGLDAMAGAGARLYADVLGLPLLELDHPDPRALVAAAADRVLARADGDPLTPLYLRRPDAVEPSAAKPLTAKPVLQ